jgi:hypothetical protein
MHIPLQKQKAAFSARRNARPSGARHRRPSPSKTLRRRFSLLACDAAASEHAYSAATDSSACRSTVPLPRWQCHPRPRGSDSNRGAHCPARPWHAPVILCRLRCSCLWWLHQQVPTPFNSLSPPHELRWIENALPCPCPPPEQQV